MTSEPLDVGPRYGGDQRVTQADRNHVAHLVEAAGREGRLSQLEVARPRAYAGRRPEGGEGGDVGGHAGKPATGLHQPTQRSR